MTKESQLDLNSAQEFWNAEPDNLSWSTICGCLYVIFLSYSCCSSSSAAGGDDDDDCDDDDDDCDDDDDEEVCPAVTRQSWRASFLIRGFDVGSQRE